MIEQYYENIRYLQFDHLRQFPELIHGIFTRQGGYSSAPYHSLNTSAPRSGSGDNIEDVVRNRQLAMQALHLSGTPNVTLWQIHSAQVLALKGNEPWRTDWDSMTYYTEPWTSEFIRQGDALITQERDIALALSFADCVPITFYDPVQQVAGIAHGGWRGTARGIVLATIEEMQRHYGSRPQDIRAGIAPAIGPCCYEVSHEVQDLFLGRTTFDVLPTEERYRARINEFCYLLNSTTARWGREPAPRSPDHKPESTADGWTYPRTYRDHAHLYQLPHRPLLLTSQRRGPHRPLCRHHGTHTTRY